MNLDKLQKIAEAATPGPRVLEMSEGQFARSALVRAPGWGIVAVVGLAPDLPHWDGPQRANARLTAACDPQTVLRLIAVARAARDAANGEFGSMPALRSALAELDAQQEPT